ncbi:unnamed protein product [Sphagnum balticum]
MHGIDDGPIYSSVGVTLSALAVQMFGHAQDLQQQNVWYDDGPIHRNIPLTSSALVAIHNQPTTVCQGTIANLCFVFNWQTNSPELRDQPMTSQSPKRWRHSSNGAKLIGRKKTNNAPSS